jgi:hypothetical protein
VKRCLVETFLGETSLLGIRGNIIRDMVVVPIFVMSYDTTKSYIQHEINLCLSDCVGLH